MSEPTPPSRLPSGATPEGDGIAVGTGPVRVDMWIDFLCPFCKQFELNASDTLARLAGENRVTLVYHPMNFLDEASTTAYSTRASVAAACAADQDGFVVFTHRLFVHQPPEGGPGLSDGELGNIGRAAGLDGTAFTSCLAGRPYGDWPSYVTAKAVEAGVSGTPTVRVDGEDVDPTGEAVDAAVTKALG